MALREKTTSEYRVLNINTQNPDKSKIFVSSYPNETVYTVVINGNPNYKWYKAHMIIYSNDLIEMILNATRDYENTVLENINIIIEDYLLSLPEYDNYETSEGISSTTNATPLIKLQVIEAFELDKHYEWKAMWEINNSNTSGDIEVDVTEDGLQVAYKRIEPKDSLNWYRGGACGSIEGTGLVKTITIRYWNSGSGTGSIRRARLEIKSIRE